MPTLPPPRLATTQENSRVQWMEYFVASGKLTEAKELGWDGKTPPPPGGGGGGGLCAVFAKCFGPSGGAGGMGGGGEETRKADFVKAVRNYEWDKATALASGAEETQVRPGRPAHSPPPLAPWPHTPPCRPPRRARSHAAPARRTRAHAPAPTHPRSRARCAARPPKHVQDVADSKNRVEWMDYHTAQVLYPPPAWHVQTLLGMCRPLADRRRWLYCPDRRTDPSDAPS